MRTLLQYLRSAAGSASGRGRCLARGCVWIGALDTGGRFAFTEAKALQAGVHRAHREDLSAEKENGRGWREKLRGVVSREVEEESYEVAVVMAARRVTREAGEDDVGTRISRQRAGLGTSVVLAAGFASRRIRDVV